MQGELREKVASAAEALERLDEAEGLCRWACVTMDNKERYCREVGAFWDVVTYLRELRDASISSDTSKTNAE